MSPIDYDSIAPLYDVYVSWDLDVPFFTDAARGAGGPVLELMAGTGRLSIPLIEAGVDLTCVDSSPGMLDVLARKLAARGLRASLHCADVCRVELQQRFELAILPFQSFMEIIGAERQRAALAATFASLRPAGRFICTLHNPAIRRAQVDGALRIVGRFPLEGGSLVVSGFEEGGEPVVRRTQYFEFFGPDGRLIWKCLLPMEFEFVEQQDFVAMAAGAGFRVVDLYGTYERAPFDPATSPVMIWLLERSA